MDCQQFMNSMFEALDVWTDSLDAAHYLQLCENVLEAVMEYGEEGLFRCACTCTTCALHCDSVWLPARVAR